jgi:hypothetical protein
MSGPVIPPIPIKHMPNAVTIGRIFGGQAADMIMSPPFMSPEDPIPVTARPMINTLLVFEIAHIRLPSSKITRKLM